MMKDYKHYQFYQWTGVVTLIILLATVLRVEGAQAQQLDKQYVSSAEASISSIQTYKQGTKLTKVLSRIEEKYNVNFFFKTDLLAGKTITEPIAVDFGDKLYEVMDQLLVGSGFTYKVLTHRTIGIVPESNDKKQEINFEMVTGTVSDASSGETLPGVNVLVKGTTTGTSTDSEGNYELNVPSLQDTLVFLFIGYQTRQIPINGRTTINVELQSQAITGEELVVTGYSVQQKSEITGSISTVDVEDISNTSTHNPLNALQGRVAGLNITRDGTPGGGTRNISIRGFNTLGNNEPLYIIDGLPVGRDKMDQLNSSDIESMQVLKDASAASIYGSRASNGVIIITTKKAAEGELQVQVNSSVSMQEFPTHRKVTNTEQRGIARWQAYINDGEDPNTDPHYDYEWHTNDEGYAELDNIEIIDWLDQDVQGGIRAADTDWFEEISRPGIIANNNISLSNGSENHRLMVSIGHHKNQGIVKYTGYERFTARVNSSINFFDGKLTIGENLQVTKGSQEPMGDGIGGTTSRLAIRQLPILPVRAEDGSFAGPIGAGMSDRMNPLLTADLARMWENNVNSLFGNIHVDFSPLPNLTFNSNFGLNYNEGTQLRINPRFRSGFLSRNTNDMSEEITTESEWTWYNTLNYELDTGKHSANLLAGVEATESTLNFNRLFREEFLLETEEFFEFDAGTGPVTLSGSETGFQLLSYFSKIEYSFDDRYLATVTLRYDGSSRFGENNRFGFFPAASLGWRIGSERFIQENVDFLSQLTLRAGAGRTGNQRIGNNASLALFRPGYGLTAGGDTPSPFAERPIGSAYDLNGADSGTLPSGVVKTQTANPNLQWESTEEINVGIDFGFLEQRITGSFDYFFRETSDILVQPPRLSVAGDGSQKWENGATMENKGWEVVLGYNDQAGDISYQIDASLGHFKDKVTFVPETVVRSYPGNVEKTILGQSISSLFGYVTDGIFQNQQEVSTHADQPGKDIGRIRYKDLNGDGVINSLDQDWLGAEIPGVEYGLNFALNYKDISLTFFLQGVEGLELLNSRKNMEIIGTGTVSGENYSIRTLEAWTPQNRDTDIPALSLTDTNNEDRMSDYYVEDASYLKLKQLRIAYALPDNIINTLRMSRAQVYISGSELFTIKTGDFSGPDPENPASFYPIPRTITLGFNVTF